MEATVSVCCRHLEVCEPALWQQQQGTEVKREWTDSHCTFVISLRLSLLDSYCSPTDVIQLWSWCFISSCSIKYMAWAEVFSSPVMCLFSLAAWTASLSWSKRVPLPVSHLNIMLKSTQLWVLWGWALWHTPVTSTEALKRFKAGRLQVWV